MVGLRKRSVLFGLAAVAAHWVSGCTNSDDQERIRHPLRYEIKHTGGTAAEIEQVVRNDLMQIDQSGGNLALYLEENEFRDGACSAVGPKCYWLEFGSLIVTSVFVRLAPRGDQAAGWRLDDVRVGFTGP
jgi:hypothetical protein